MKESCNNRSAEWEQDVIYPDEYTIDKDGLIIKY